MRYAIIESPYAGEVAVNIEYAERCLLDSIERGEVPLAGHLLYTRVLDDGIPEDRERGLMLQMKLIELVTDAYGAASADDSISAVLAVYTDRGISEGMQRAISMAAEIRLRIEFRKLGA